MPQTQSYRVMWSLVDGSELGVAVEAAKHNTDDAIRERAWEHIMVWIHPILRPRNKSDMRVIRRTNT